MIRGKILKIFIQIGISTRLYLWWAFWAALECIAWEGWRSDSPECSKQPQNPQTEM